MIALCVVGVSLMTSRELKSRLRANPPWDHTQEWTRSFCFMQRGQIFVYKYVYCHTLKCNKKYFVPRFLTSLGLKDCLIHVSANATLMSWQVRSKVNLGKIYLKTMPTVILGWIWDFFASEMTKMGDQNERMRAIVSISTILYNVLWWIQLDKLLNQTSLKK